MWYMWEVLWSDGNNPSISTELPVYEALSIHYLVEPPALRSRQSGCYCLLFYRLKRNKTAV